MQNSLISVVIATKNEERNVANCIKSILEQTAKNVEIIVVDNNSSDRTREIARKFTDKVYNLPDAMELTGIRNYRGAQVNLGVGKSKGDIIFFPDADMTFDPQLLLDGKIKLQACDALYVPEIVCGRGWFGKLRNFERSFYDMTCIDAVRIVKKSVFSAAGGFDAKNIMFAPDDWDFTKTLKKMKAKLSISDRCLYHHEEWMTLKVYLKKKMNYTNTFDGYIVKWGKADDDIKKQFGFWYRYFGVFVEDGKSKRLFANPIKAFSMFFIRFLVGAVYILKR
jgi:glycosyltransferase involved in cell wall biosynthesis